MTRSQEDRASAFRALHESGTFVIPNPWDAGSAKAFESLGFEALATTSSGHAFTLGRHDGGVTLDEVVEHVRVLSAASTLPLSVDLENGYGPAPSDAAEAVTRVAEAGAVGGSIEDFDPDEDAIYEVGRAAERIAAAAEAARGFGFPFMLTGRAENHFRGNPDLDDTIGRLQAYEAAGADVLYAPRLRTVEELRAIVDSVSAPVNALVNPKLSYADLAGAGARRISVGGNLAWVGMAAVARAAIEMRDQGDFSSIDVGMNVGELLDG